MQRLATGIATLDALLLGGIPEGATVLVAGGPGTGKTILAHQMLFANAGPDSTCVYMTTLSEPMAKVLRFQQEFSFFDVAKVQRSLVYQDVGSALRQGGPARMMELVDEILRRHTPRLVVIDSVTTLAEMLPSFPEARAFMVDLSLRLATWGCTTLLLAEYREDQIDVRPESAIADGIIYLSGMEERRQQRRVLRILKMRGTAYPGGENGFQIGEAGIDLYPRLHPNVADQRYARFDEERLATGVPGLDDLVGGGLPRGTATIVSGPAGSGKTLVAASFAAAGLAREEPALLVAFEEEPGQLAANACRVGIAFEPGLRGGLLDILHVSPIELDVDAHIYGIQRATERLGARRLVVDSISAFEIGMRDKVKFTDHIWAMTDHFKSRGVTVMMTHELLGGGTPDVVTTHGVSFVADNLLQISNIVNGRESRRLIRVLKMRSSEHITGWRELHIGRDGLAVLDLHPTSADR